MGGIAGATRSTERRSLLAAAIAYLLVLTAAAFLTPAAARAGPSAFPLASGAAHNEGAPRRVAAEPERPGLPRDRYRVFVVTDNCTDATAAIARAHGAVV